MISSSVLNRFSTLLATQICFETGRRAGGFSSLVITVLLSPATLRGSCPELKSTPPKCRRSHSRPHPRAAPGETLSSTAAVRKMLLLPSRKRNQSLNKLKPSFLALSLHPQTLAARADTPKWNYLQRHGFSRLQSNQINVSFTICTKFRAFWDVSIANPVAGVRVRLVNWQYIVNRTVRRLLIRCWIRRLLQHQRQCQEEMVIECLDQTEDPVCGRCDLNEAQCLNDIF